MRAAIRLRRALPGALLAPALGAAVALAAPPAPAAGQQLRDSLQDVVRERLERLTRRLGDTTGLLPADSTDNNLGEVVTTDSTLLALLALPGYDLVQYRGQSAVFETESRLLTLTGADGAMAAMNREGVELAADSALVFNEKTGRLQTVGQEATYRPENGDEVLAQSIIYDVNQGRGTASDVRTQMNAGLGDWIVRGDFPSVNPDVSYGHDVLFTSCDEEEPHYHFVAREIKISPGGTLVAKNVLLYFSDVGVFWLPFIAQSTEQGRRSGLLPVRFSVNDIVRTSGGYSRRLSNLGFYWAINDYADAELALDWWSGNNTGLGGRVQYHWLRQFLEGNLAFTQRWLTGGGSSLSFDTNHNWEISERSRLSMSARYTSDSDFVRQNSFDPREVTQSIDSDGGFNRRFDWGTLSLGANRRQFLSDDRVEMTLPTANLSLSTITLFPAPFNRARFYNNATLSASGRISRSMRDQPVQTPSEENPFQLSLADDRTWAGGLGVNFSVGAFSVSQNLDINRYTALGLPGDFFNPSAPAAQRAGIGSVGDLQRSILHPFGALDPIDFTAETLTWSTSMNWQQTLVGSTTLTPQLAISGRSIRSDTITVGGGGFVAAPSRISFGAQLSSDFYGFFMGGRLRHKVSPVFDFALSPEVTPDPVQLATFGNSAVQPRKELRFGINQTFEMRVDDPAADSAAQMAQQDDGGPRRLPQSQKVTILALRSSAVTYDFEQASRLGHFTRGFADNLRISHQISSDYLRGLSVSMEHLVFDDLGLDPSGGSRKFSPFISNVNLGFSMGNETSLFRWLRGLAGGGGGEEDEGADRTEQSAEQSREAFDHSGFESEDLGESTIVPRGGRERSQAPRSTGEVGKWDASFTYSLARARGDGARDNQMLQGTLSFQPTEKWAVRWRTSYDVTGARFNDHMISLQREMHRWDAEFSFRQTATGNWTFLFEVALADNRDLHFDYEQRTGDAQRRRRR